MSDLKAVIFDIDGTLANTLPVCVDTYRVILEKYVGRPFAEEEITRCFGMAEEGILGVYLPAEQIPTAADEYFKVYEDLHQSCAEPFDGLRAAMERLHHLGVPLGVVTGKGRRGTEVTLRVLGLEPLLQTVEFGFDEGPNKPLSLRNALQSLGLQPHQAVYIGDTAYDVEAASSIGMPVVGAAWAETTTIRNGAGAKALRVFDRIKDFTDWLEVTFPG